MTAEEFLTTNDLNPSRKTYTRGDVIAFAEEYYTHKMRDPMFYPKRCTMPNVINLNCVHPFKNVYQSETECYCELCGHDFTEDLM